MNIHAYRSIDQQASACASDAQSIAVGLDHPSIEPLHLMQALLEQQGGSIKPLLMQVGFDINALRQALTKELDQLPAAEPHR